MPHSIEQIAALESSLFEALEDAEDHGLGAAEGRSAFQRAMTALDETVSRRSELLYAPLSADPLTRDYVSHLDSQLLGLSARIDVLRTHIELALESGSEEIAALNASLGRLSRQLQVRFSRESALIPVYFSWRDRHPAAASA